jgi:iron(III) transport system substrate-binding protein
MKRLIALIALCLFVLASSATAQNELTMYTAFDVDEARRYIEAFEEAHPEIEVNWSRMSSGEVLARVSAEANNPQASIWFAGSSTSHIAAANQGLLEPYCESEGYQALPDDFKDPDCLWSGIYTGFIGFATNTEFLEENDLEAPDSWDDLLDPAYENEIAKAFPYTSGTAYTTLVSQLQAIGPEQRGWDDESREYIRQLSEQVHHYTRSGSACVTETGLGEVNACISFSHDIAAKGIAQGYPITMSFPEEGTGFEVGAISIIDGAPQPEAARTFYDWMLSAEAQSLFQGWYRVPLNPDAEVAEGVVRAEDVELIDGFADHVPWYGENKEAIIDEWRQITGR